MSQRFRVKCQHLMLRAFSLVPAIFLLALLEYRFFESFFGNRKGFETVYFLFSAAMTILFGYVAFSHTAGPFTFEAEVSLEEKAVSIAVKEQKTVIAGADIREISFHELKLYGVRLYLLAIRTSRKTHKLYSQDVAPGAIPELQKVYAAIRHFSGEESL